MYENTGLNLCVCLVITGMFQVSDYFFHFQKERLWTLNQLQPIFISKPLYG